MQSPDPLRDLELLVRSRYGIIYADTPEEGRLGVLLRHVADRLGVACFLWSRTKGLRNAAELDADGNGPVVYGSELPAAALTHLETAGLSAVCYFPGLGSFLGDPVVSGKLADAAQRLAKATGAVVLTGADIAFPESLKPMMAPWSLPEPDAADFTELVGQVVRELSKSQDVPVRLAQGELNLLISNLRGLTLMEAQKVLTRAIVEDGGLCADAMQEVLAAKRAIVERDGLLEYTPAGATVADIAGLAGLKAWLDKRRRILQDPQAAAQFGLSFPRGILLLGVQGCGKSLCAKAVSGSWSLPLLKLDPSGLYNKYVGESERNFQKAVRIAERVAPVVLWIDELEKAFAQSGGEDDGGVSQRILGTFLSWLQDRKGDVFVVATANDVSRLPPEFIRKGRFDEIFFVDLPTAEARASIFRLHLAKRGKDPAAFDLAALASATEGFSGAELEQVVVSALYTAFSAGQALTTELLLREAAQTVPLSKTMREPVERLRQWAASRTVSAN